MPMLLQASNGDFGITAVIVAAAIALVVGAVAGIVIFNFASGRGIKSARAEADRMLADAKAQGELADRLESGEITSEKAAADWFGIAGQEARKRAFLPLLRAEAMAFGSENWTAEKHARYIRRYAKNGQVP